MKKIEINRYYSKKNVYEIMTVSKVCHKIDVLFIL